MAADGVVRIDVILDDKQVSGGVKRVEGRLSGIAGTAKRGLATIGKLAGALGLVGLAYKGIDMVKNSLDGAIDRYDTLNNFPRVMQQLGFDAQASDKAIKRLSDGIQGLPTRLDEVASTAQRIAVMTGDLDGAVETTLALNNAFLASGASTADAARGLEQYVQMLAKGEVDLQSWRTLQETMGLALNQLAKDFGFTGKSAQNDLYEALKSGKITFEEFNDALIEASNKTGGFAEMALTSSGGIKTALTNMSTWVVMGVTKVIEAIDKALGGTGSIENAIKRLRPIVDGFFGWIAGTAIPAVAEAIKFVIGLFKEWSPSIDGIKNAFTTAFETIQSVVVPIISEVVNFIMEIWGGLVAWWQENGQQIAQAVQNAFQFILTIVQAVMPAVLFIVNMVWSAVKDIITGAISVIQGVIHVFTAIFTGDWKQLWEGIKKIVSGAIKLVVGWLSLSFMGAIRKIFTNLLKNGVNIIKNMWSQIVNFFKNFGTNAQNVVSNIVSRVLNWFRNLLNNAKSIFTTLRTFGASIWNSLKEAIFGAVRSIFNNVRNIFSNILSVVRNLNNNIRSTITTVWNRIKSYLSGINLFNIGKNIIQGLIKGIGSMASAVVDKVKSIGESAVNGIKSILKIASPSKVLEQIGKWTGQGFIKGLSGTTKKVSATTKKMADEALKNLKIKFDTLKINPTTYIKSLQKVAKQYRLTSEQARTLKKEVHRASSTIANAVTTINKQTEKANTSLLTKIRNINSKLQQDINKLKLDFAKQVKETAQSIYNQMRLFDEVSVEKISGETLLKNLKEQNKVFKQWQSNLNKIAKSGAPKAFVDELREMGVGSAAEIAAIASMTRKQLDEYVKAWKEKHALANKEANIQLAEQKKQMEKQIKELTKAANAEINKARAEWRKELSKLSSEVAKLGTFKNSGKVLGKETINGIISGLKSMKGPLASTAKSLAKSIEKEMKKALKIKSPSRIMRDEIGKMIPAGIGVGINKYQDAALKSMRLLASKLVNEANLLGDLQGLTANKALSRYVNRGFASTYGTSNVTNNNTKSFNPIINNYFTRDESKPSEVARKNKQQQQRLAMEWGLV